MPQPNRPATRNGTGQTRQEPAPSVRDSANRLYRTALECVRQRERYSRLVEAGAHEFEQQAALRVACLCVDVRRRLVAQGQLAVARVPRIPAPASQLRGERAAAHLAQAREVRRAHAGLRSRSLGAARDAACHGRLPQGQSRRRARTPAADLRRLTSIADGNRFKPSASAGAAGLTLMLLWPGCCHSWRYRSARRPPRSLRGGGPAEACCAPYVLLRIFAVVDGARRG
jgi:hypothetical protein